MSNCLQENRFERKYIISEACARGVRDFARSYLCRDPFADPKLDYAYAIHSVYLDSPDLSLCHATVQGHKNRFKLRVRYYDGDPAKPIFFEIKRRVNDAILKRRAAVRRESMVPLLSGHWPSPSDLSKSGDEKSLDALQQFCTLRERIGGKGQVIVSYLREAWVSSGHNGVRLTFDRCLTATPWHNKLIVPDLKAGCHPPVPGVVLELKFTDRAPTWMIELSRVFNLQRCSMPKYVECINALATPARTDIDYAEASNRFPG